MHSLLRKPLTWMVLAECAIVAALVLLAWHMLAATAAQGATAPAPDTSASASAGAVATPLPDLQVPRTGAPRSLPGLNLAAGFWRLRLGSLNRDEAAFEALEWRLAHAVIESARGYLETVVLPAVRRAEGGG